MGLYLKTIECESFWECALNVYTHFFFHCSCTSSVSYFNPPDVNIERSKSGKQGNSESNTNDSMDGYVSFLSLPLSRSLSLRARLLVGKKM